MFIKALLRRSIFGVCSGLINTSKMYHFTFVWIKQQPFFSTFHQHIDISLQPKITFHTINNSANLYYPQTCWSYLPQMTSNHLHILQAQRSQLRSLWETVKHRHPIAKAILYHHPLIPITKPILDSVCQPALDRMDPNLLNKSLMWTILSYYKDLCKLHWLPCLSIHVVTLHWLQSN